MIKPYIEENKYYTYSQKKPYGPRLVPSGLYFFLSFLALRAGPESSSLTELEYKGTTLVP